MAHVLAKLTGAAFADVERQLQQDAATHAEWGMYLEHPWKNIDSADEVLFLFRVDDLERCRQRIRVSMPRRVGKTRMRSCRSWSFLMVTEGKPSDARQK